MSDPANDGKSPKAMTAADVAKLLGGTVRVLRKGKDGKVGPVDRPLIARDVLDFVDHGDRIVAVTIDGQRREVAAGTSR